MALHNYFADMTFSFPRCLKLTSKKLVTPLQPKLSIVVAFYNMRREAVRTLFSLTTAYQQHINKDDYEVIVLDSNSSEPLQQEWVESLQSNFIYRYISTSQPTPCKAMNTGISIARAEHIVCMIDGARILSPGILSNMMRINGFAPNAFIQTISMHIGSELQNISVTKGYNQKVEDRLIATIDWELNGYHLFDISSLAASSKRGYLHPLSESNCFSAPKKKLLEINGFDENFQMPGGGLVNLDVMNRINEDLSIEPYVLLGEASFHQFHGGVATNVPLDEHPSEIFREEYMTLRRKPFLPNKRQPTFYGRLNGHSMKCIIP